VDHQLPAADPGNNQQAGALKLQRAGIGLSTRSCSEAFLPITALSTPVGGALGDFQLSGLPVSRALNEMNFDLAPGRWA